MKFKLDENLPRECAACMRDAGFDAQTTVDENLAGRDDMTLSAHCQGEQRILISLDLDFANLQLYPPRSHAGIIVLRPATQDKLTLVSLITRLLPVFASKSPNGQLWIVEIDRIRIREE